MRDPHFEPIFGLAEVGKEAYLYSGNSPMKDCRVSTSLVTLTVKPVEVNKIISTEC